MKKKRLAVIVGVITVVIISVGLLYNHFFCFSAEKWEKYPEMRINMIESLERQYEIKGKTENEITELLGEAVITLKDEYTIFQYYVGDSLSDPYTYNISFKDGICVSFGVVEH